jgi:hypothetical protein
MKNGKFRRKPTLSSSPLIAGVFGIAVTMGGDNALAGMADVDWASVPPKTIKLFWPGQSTYQWLRSPEHKRPVI